MITCGDCVRALNPYLDRELDDDDVAQVKIHLEECGGCLHLFEFESSLRLLVRVRCHEQSAPEKLRTRVMELLQNERVRLASRKRSKRPKPSY